MSVCRHCGEELEPPAPVSPYREHIAPPDPVPETHDLAMAVGRLPKDEVFAFMHGQTRELERQLRLATSAMERARRLQRRWLVSITALNVLAAMVSLWRIFL